MGRNALTAFMWIGALGLAALFLSPLRTRRPPDFLPFYLGGKLAASGQIERLYDKAAYQPMIAELRAQGVEMNDRFDSHYFIRPAFQAFFYAPFGRLSYPTAARTAFLMNVALLAILVWKLPVWFGASPLVRIGLVCFLPFLWTAAIGQDTLLLTLLVALSFRLAEQNRYCLAGVLLGLCCYKPHVIWMLPLAFAAAGRRRALSSFAATTGALAAVSLAAVGPEGIRQWLSLLRDPSTDILPETMGNLRAIGLQWGSAAAAVGLVLTAASAAILLWKGGFDQKVSAALFAAALVSPHTYWQDYSPAAIVAMASPHPAAKMILLAPWPYFYSGSSALPYGLACLALLVTMAAGCLLGLRVARAELQT